MLSNKSSIKKMGALLFVGIMATVYQSTGFSAEADKSDWSGASELGFVMTDGNTETQSLNAKLGVSRDWQDWRQSFNLEALSSSQTEVTSAERYLAETQLDRKLTEVDFIFGKLAYVDDRFSGFDYEATLTAGYGRTLINDDSTSLTVEAGPGYRVSKPENASSEEEAILGTALAFRQKISDTSEFGQTLNVDIGEERTVSTSVTSLSSQVAGRLAMKLSLTLKNNSDPLLDELGEEKEGTDVETAVTLVYAF